MKRGVVLLAFLCIFVHSIILEYTTAGTPHTAYGKIFNSDDTVPANSDITFNSYIKSRSSEVLTQSSTGCDYSSGYWSVAVGNFPTAWSVGDVLSIDVINTINGETGLIEVTMTSAGGDAAPDLRLEPVVPVELSSFSAMMKQGQVTLAWTTETEANNLGFEIFRKQQNDGFLKIGFVQGHGTSTVRHNYSFVDDQLANGTYYYQLKQIDHNGSFHLSETKSIIVSLPSDFGLLLNYPNPFNSETMIHYRVSLQDPANVELYIYNSLGELVRILVNEQQASGKYTVVWDGRDYNGNMMSSGIYIGRLIMRNHFSNLKMIYMK
jgi:hypothetical protein